MARISIITPLYNKEQYIGETIRSVATQSVTDWEMLVVDNGSTDKSAEVVRQFTDPRIRLINSPKKGPGAARNFGLTATDCEWVLFLDADDLLEPTQLADQLATAAAHPEADIVVGCWNDILDGRDGTKKLQKPPGYPKVTQGLRDSAVGYSPWACHAAIVRRSRLVGDYVWPESMDRFLAEDVSFWFKLVTTFEVVYGQAQGAIYRFLTAGCRTDFTSDKWYGGLDAAVQENLNFLARQHVSLTTGQCDQLMRLYSELYVNALQQNAGDIATEALTKAKRWMASYFELGGEWNLPMLIRRGMGLKMFLHWRK